MRFLFKFLGRGGAGPLLLLVATAGVFARGHYHR